MPFKLDHNFKPPPSVLYARITPEIHRELKKRAEETGCTMSEIIRQMVEYCLKEWKKEDV